MSTHITRLAKNLESFHYKNFNHVAINDGYHTVHIPAEAWPKLIEVLTEASKMHPNEEDFKDD